MPALLDGLFAGGEGKGMKRGDSGMCLVVGVDKPEGKSSHDVVNACRRIFGERRVGPRVRSIRFGDGCACGVRWACDQA